MKPPAGVSCTRNCVDCPAVRLAAAGVAAKPKSEPVPERATLWGCPGAASLIVNNPLKLPLELGAKVTVRVQLAPAAKLVPQVLVSAKAEGDGVKAMLLMVSACSPLLLKVTVCELLVVLAIWVEKVRLPGDTLTEEPVPVPVSAIVCVLAFTAFVLSVMVMVAVRVPRTVGVKVTLITQLEPGATVKPQALLSAKSLAFAPLIAVLVIVRAPVPVFFRVTVSGALATATGCRPKSRLVGARLTEGVVPLPVRATV